MLIKDTRKEIKKFGEVKMGDVVYLLDDELSDLTYMVIKDCDDGDNEYNLVCLNDGSLSFYAVNEYVEVLNAELVIKK